MSALFSKTKSRNLKEIIYFPILWLTKLVASNCKNLNTSELHKHGRGEWEPLSFSDEILYLLPLLNQLGFLPEWLKCSYILHASVVWQNKSSSLCRSSVLYKLWEKDIFLCIIQNSSFEWLMCSPIEDKSPDKKLALQMDVKTLVLFVENLSRFVYCFVSNCLHPSLLAAFPFSLLPLSKLYLVLLSCWWLPLLTKHVFSAIPVLKSSLLITSKHHWCVYLSSWHLFSMTSSQSCSLITLGTIKVLLCVAKQSS